MQACMHRAQRIRRRGGWEGINWRAGNEGAGRCVLEQCNPSAYLNVIRNLQHKLAVLVAVLGEEPGLKDEPPNTAEEVGVGVGVGGGDKTHNTGKGSRNDYNRRLQTCQRRKYKQENKQEEEKEEKEEDEKGEDERGEEAMTLQRAGTYNDVCVGKQAHIIVCAINRGSWFISYACVWVNAHA